MDKSLEQFIIESRVEYYKIQKDYSSLFNLLKVCRKGKFYHIGYYVGKILEQTGNWKYLDELAVCAYWIGEYKESADINKKLLEHCPEIDKPRIMLNIKYAQEQEENQ